MLNFESRWVDRWGEGRGGGGGGGDVEWVAGCEREWGDECVGSWWWGWASGLIVGWSKHGNKCGDTFSLLLKVTFTHVSLSAEIQYKYAKIASTQPSLLSPLTHPYSPAPPPQSSRSPDSSIILPYSFPLTRPTSTLTRSWGFHEGVRWRQSDHAQSVGVYVHVVVLSVWGEMRARVCACGVCVCGIDTYTRG